jgi:hypothetical protein
MSRKPKPEIARAELLPSSRTPSAADFKRMVAEAIEKHVSEAMAHDADLQPWFQSREVAYEIKRRQTVVEQNKFAYYFEDWGCIICGTKQRRHAGLGLCPPCNSRVRQRLSASMRKHAPAPGRTDLTFMDTVRMAREALAPALHALPETTARPARRKRVRQ